MKKVLSIGLLVAIASVAYAQSVVAKREPLEDKDKAADVNVPKITAAEIVRAVRESENWLHRIDSLVLRVESRSTHTPEQIEGAIAESKAISIIRYDPNLLKLDPNQGFKKSFPSISTYELAFDKNRYRFVTKSWNLSRIAIWDGKQLLAYYKYFNPERESYGFSPTKDPIEYDKMFEILIWLQTQPHSFWWDSSANFDSKRFPSPEEFVLKGTTNYRGIDCYILERVHPLSPGSPPTDTKYRNKTLWYVGKKDKFLYGYLAFQGSRISREDWTTDYKEVAPGCFFPMKQGRISNYSFYDRDGTKKIYKTGGQTDIEITDIRVNEKLPDELFEIKFKQGVEVTDNRFGGTVRYTYKADRTEEEWNQIREEARKKSRKE